MEWTALEAPRGGGRGGVSSGDPQEMIWRGRLCTDVRGAWDGLAGRLAEAWVEAVLSVGKLVVVSQGTLLQGLDMHRYECFPLRVWWDLV